MDALERVYSDPAYERALRRSYRGRHDVLDALWWAAHPLTESAGLADPAVEVKELQRAAFARTSDPVLASENLRRLQEAQNHVAEDARLLADALDDADRLSRPPSAETQEIVADAAPRPRRKLLLPLCSGVALLVAIMVLPALMQPDAAPGAAPAGALKPPDRVQTEIVSFGSSGSVPNPLAVLDREQTTTDLPPDEFHMDDNVASYRALPELAPFVQLYLARQAEPVSVCLVVVRRDQSGMSGCTTESEFSKTGIDVSGAGRYDLADGITVLSKRFFLSPEGEFQFEATVRTTGDAEFPQVG